MMYRRLLAIAVLLVAAVVRTSEAQPATSPLWNNLESGSHSVGFTVYYIFDDARSYLHPDSTPTDYQGRPIRIMVWYPAQDAPGEPTMPFSGYIEVEPYDPAFRDYFETLHTLDSYMAQAQFAPRDPELYQMLLRTPTQARRDVAPAAGRFPLLLHSLGLNDYQQESTVLWEYLASHGYVVAVIPLFGPDPSRLRLEPTLADLEIQQRDLGVALARLVHAANIDETRIGLIGYSFGSGAALLLALENRNIDALVSLDGVLTMSGTLIREVESADLDPESLTLPILNVYAAGRRDLDLDFIDGLEGSDRYHVALGTESRPQRALHGDFQNWPLYAVLAGRDNAGAQDSRPRELGRDFYLAACRMTLAFVDAVLKGDAGAMRRLRGEDPLPLLDPTLIEFRFDERTR